ncbi:MAG: DNA repair protein RecO [Gammaproteobacteria bacterium]|nr:DNA repair protein RecO [Gammaproteobacteria bacterium]
MIASGNSDRGVLLHRRPYTDSRWLVDFLTDRNGRISGVHRTGSKHQSSLELFVEYSIAWRGKSQLVTISQCEVEKIFPIEGRKLYLGLYLNELVAKTTRPEEHVEGLFGVYVDSISAIGGERSDVEPILRSFERTLLKGLGYEIAFDVEASNGNAIDPAERYEYLADGGFRRLENGSAEGFDGASLLAISRNDYSQARTRAVAKFVLRSALQHRIGDQKILSRSLFGSKVPQMNETSRIT